MFLDTEKKLVKKNYHGYYNTNNANNTTFVYSLNPIDQIILEQTQNYMNQTMWKVSFPLKFSKMNYATFFKDEKSAKKYIKNIVETYI